MKTLKSIVIALAVALISVPALADEGMWLLPLLEKMNIKTMQQMGCELSAADIYNIQGQQLNKKPDRGVFIQSGRKYAGK